MEIKMSKKEFVVLLALCISSSVFAAAPKKQGLSGAIAIAKNAVGCRDSGLIYANLGEKISTMVISPQWKVVKENKNAALVSVTGRVKADGKKSNETLFNATSVNLYPVQAQHSADYSDLVLRSIDMGFLVDKNTKQVELVGGIRVSGIHGMVMKDNLIQQQMCIESLKVALKKWSNIQDDFTADKFHKVRDADFNEIHVWEVSFENRGRNGANGLIAIDIPNKKAKELSGGTLLPIEFGSGQHYITKSFASGQGTFGGNLQLISFKNVNSKELITADYFGGDCCSTEEEEGQEKSEPSNSKNVAWGKKIINDTEYFAEFIEVGTRKECNFYQLDSSGVTKVSLDTLGMKTEDCFPFSKMFVDTSE